MEEIISKLKEIGLNEYQSKVYFALLKKHPATGYEISKIANIPQARAYDTLKALESMHIVIASKIKPTTYTPIKPKELTKRYKRKIESTIDFLDKKLPDIKLENYTEPILSISGKSKIIEKSIELIKAAKRTIHIGLFANDFKFLEQHLLDAYNDGVDVKIVKYDRFICNFGRAFDHFGIPFLEHYKSNKFIFLSIDDQESLFGVTENQKNEIPEIIWSKNQEITFLIKSFMQHDMYLIDISENFPEQLKYFYGSGLKRLHDKILH